MTDTKKTNDELQIDNFLKDLYKLQTQETQGTKDTHQSQEMQITQKKNEPLKVIVTPEFDAIVNSYLKTQQKPVCVNILTPCYGGVNHVEYTQSLINTIILFSKYGINHNLYLLGKESLIQRARNNLVAASMLDSDMTHLFFIDSDIVWNPVDVIKLIISDKDLIGGIYPIKHYHWDRLDVEQINQIMEKHKLPYNQNINKLSFLKHNLLNYCVNYLNEVKINNNILEIKTLPTGFMMIKRSCIEKMMAYYEDTKYIDDQHVLQRQQQVDGKQNYVYALFECGKVDGHYYSEDWMFCHRWRQMGGKVYTDVSVTLSHIGNEVYNGRFISALDLDISRH